MQVSTEPIWLQALHMWPLIWANDAGRYVIAAGLTALVLRALTRWGSGAGWAARQVRIRAVRPGQAIAEFVLSMRTALLFSLMGTGVWCGHALGWFQIYSHVGDHGWAYWGASLLGLIVLHDAWFYWTHRLLHRPWLMRHAHRTHHQSLAPTPWTAYSFGLLDAALQMLFLPLVLLLAPVHGAVLAVWGIHQIVRNVWGHSGAEIVPLSWLRGAWGRWFTTTLHHEMHHAHAGGHNSGGHNFGLYFRWWDLCCGTEHPQYAKALAELCERIEQAPSTPAHRPHSMLMGLLWVGAACAVAPPSAAQTAPPVVESRVDGRPDVRGDWATQGYGARVRIRPCDGKPDQLCGRVLWLWEPNDKSGKALVDAQNPEPALRSRPVVGLDIVHGFRPTGPHGQWSQGNIYNPEDGRTYNASMRLRSADTLELEGCVLFICAKQTWRKLPQACHPQ